MSLRADYSLLSHGAYDLGQPPKMIKRGSLGVLANLIILLSLGHILYACNMAKERHNRRGSFSSLPNINSKSSAEGQKGDNASEAEGDQGHEVEISPESLALTPETLVWKRYRALEDGLSQGLQVDKSRLCLELGQHSCIDKVHLTVLGGNEPYMMGQYEAARSPTILTGIAVDRIVLAACETRLNLDKGLGASAVVFNAFPLGATDVSLEQVRNQTASLYQKLLSRDAAAEELNIAQDILKITKTGEKVAMALCFAVGSQLENIFL